jgi:hypothetical protein
VPPSWDEVTGKPTEFPPSDHTHPEFDELGDRIDAIEDAITEDGGFVDAPDDGKLYGRQSEDWAEVVIPDVVDPDWDSITGKPTEFPPEDHTHVVADITDFDPTDYQPAGDYLTDADSDGKQYARQDGAWAEVIAGGGDGNAAIISDTAPENATEGDLWFCSLVGSEGFFCFSDDPNGGEGYWFEVSTPSKGGDGNGDDNGASVDLSNYVQKPSSTDSWMVYKDGWAPVTTDLVLTNSDIAFRDSKGRFKSTREIPELNNQLEVNRWFYEQLESIPEDVDLTGYATETYVDDSISAIPPADLTGYATETYVDDSISAIEFPVEEAPTSGLVYGRANGTWVEVTGGEGGGGTGGAGSINLAYDKLTPDGTADTFDLTLGGDAREPLGATNLLVSVNGVIQEPGVAFTTTGSTITFTEVPQADDSIDFIVELTNGSHWELNGVNLEYAGEGTKVVVDQLQANGDAVFMGSVGIGTDDPKGDLSVANANGGVFEFLPSSDNNFIRSYDRTASSYVPYAVQALTHSFNMGNNNSALFINESGLVGIGMTPVSVTFDLSAKEQLAEWKTKAKKASWPIVTKGAFEQEPTEDLVAEWMETRTAGDKLQVAGRAWFSRGATSDQGIQIESNSSANYIMAHGVNKPVTIWNLDDTNGDIIFRHTSASTASLSLKKDGNAVFSGSVSSGSIRPKYGATADLIIDAQNAGGASCFSVDARGDGNFFGTVTANSVTIEAGGVNVGTWGIWRAASHHCGVGFFGSSSADTALLPLNNDGGPVDGTVSLGSSTYKFKDAHFSGSITLNTVDNPIKLYAPDPTKYTIGTEQNGNIKYRSYNRHAFIISDSQIALGEPTIYAVGNIVSTGTVNGTRVVQDGSPVIDAKGLISTLATLRNATKDETTLEGLRDSIGNAIGGLIEKFEAEIATMPAGDES